MPTSSTAPAGPGQLTRFLSLFEDPVDGVTPFLRKAIRPQLLDGYASVVAVDSAQDTGLLAGGPPRSTLRKETPWVPARTSLREVSLTGHRDDEHGHAILQDIFGWPASFPRSVDHLYVHLMERQAADGDEGAPAFTRIDPPAGQE